MLPVTAGAQCGYLKVLKYLGTSNGVGTTLVGHVGETWSDSNIDSHVASRSTCT